MLALDRGQRQVDRALEVLAVASADVAPPLSEMLTLHETHFMRNSVVVMITASDEEDWAIELRQLERRGVRTVVVALDGASFGGEHSSEGVLTFLTSTGIPAMTVRRGDDLTHALEVGTGDVGRGI